MAQNDLEIDNLPNRLTIFRMLMIPVVVGALYLQISPEKWTFPLLPWLGHIAALIFAVASISDFFDGYIARKRNIVTVFGSFLDPIADKFLVVSSLIMLLGLERVHPVVVIILVLREMYMTSLRLLAMTEGINIPVDKLGKWKTTFQMISIPMLMIHQEFLFVEWGFWGTVLIYVSAFLSLLSALNYSASMIKKLKIKRMKARIAKKERVL
jgi:CDP-diacylglycerol--glycerol-3-phosphate 3-phosphatidyltransferase